MARQSTFAALAVVVALLCGCVSTTFAQTAHSAASVAAAAASAAGSPLPSFAVTPAFQVVQPDIQPVQPTAFTGVVVQEVVQFSDQFCTPASFSLPEAHPANYTGPGMSITFTTGTCTIPLSGGSGDNSTDGSSSGGASASSGSSSSSDGSPATSSVGGRRLFGISSSAGSGNNTAGVNITMPTMSADSGSTIQCTEPSLTIVNTPAIYTSAYTSAAEWTGKECKVAQSGATPTATVLYTFDDNNPIDPLSLASLIQSKLATILQTGYQDLIQQITSSVTLASGTVGVPGLVGNNGGSAAASTIAAGPNASGRSRRFGL